MSNQDLAFALVQTDEFCNSLLYDQETKSYWLHDGYIWKPYDKEEMRVKVSELTMYQDSNNRLTVGKMLDVVEQVKDYLGDCAMSRKIFKESGIKKEYGFKVEELEEKGISFKDKVLLLNDLRLVEHSPSLDQMAFVHLNFPYSTLSEAKSPLFDAYIKTTCTDKEGNFNQGMHDQLQEVAGFILSNERAEIAVIFQGEGRNGKSPFLDLLRAMVGKNRCSAVSLATLSKDRFCLPSLIGMKLNAKAEDESKGVNLALLKELISGEPMEARRLYEPSFTMVPRCKLIFATNNPPQLAGLDFATKDRIFIIKFEHTMQKQDYIRDLGKRMCREELPAFIRWALVGMERIKKQNCVFTQTKQSEDAMKEMEEANNSVVEYINAIWERDDGIVGVPASEILLGYFSWCKDNGRKNPMTSNKMGRIAVPILGEAYNYQNIRTYHARRKDGMDKLNNIVPPEKPLPNF